MTTTEPRARNRPGEGDRLRADIIAAADALLAETGSVERLSLRGIARAVGITAPAIYAHFATKEALLSAVVAGRFAGLAAALQAARAAPSHPDAPPPAIEVVRARARAYVRFGLEHPGHYAALFGPAADHLGLSYEASPGQAVFHALVDPVADVLVERGSPEPPVSAATDVWVAMHGIVALRSSQPGFVWGNLDEQIDRVVDRLLAS